MKSIKLSPDLAAIVGKKESSRAELMKLLWAYLKNNNLQIEGNKTFFVPDKKMAKVFGTGTMRVFSMAKHYRPHLYPIKAKNDSNDGADDSKHIGPSQRNAQNDADDEITFNFLPQQGEDNLDDAADDSDELNPYLCDICKVSFARPDHLKTHMSSDEDHRKIEMLKKILLKCLKQPDDLEEEVVFN